MAEQRPSAVIEERDGSNTDPSASFSSDSSREIAYTFVRVLGSGAFGEAVLYRKVEDDCLVVWKEVDLSRLTVKERNDSQNEIDILSMLNHTNIVSYYNHFLDGDVLLIEMEFANGGSLYHKISSQKKLFDEQVVLWYFYQILSAVAHIHEYGILHRDIKTLNIFLTKSGLVKLGDFGISRILDTKSQMVESYVGTPFYMSPELIKGEQYNQKSDMWAVGCVLYELLTLSRVFDATNALRLAAVIVSCDYEDVDARYSENLRGILHDLLNKYAEKRSTAEDALNHPIFSVTSKEIQEQIWQLNTASRKTKNSLSSATDVLPVVTAKSSEVFCWGGGRQTPQRLHIFTQGRSAVQVSAGGCHLAAVTVEKELYVWANNQGGETMSGQLGHTSGATYRTPKKVDAFESIAIKQVSCGADFTLCVTDEGGLYAFGSNYDGCLGCGGDEDIDDTCCPRPVGGFGGQRVDSVSCGDAHVIALTASGDVFTWGCGEFGRLGHGSEDDCGSPKQVYVRGRHPIRTVQAGADGSFLLHSNGRLVASGSNERNKLGFNSAVCGLRTRPVSYDIPCKLSFSTVKPLSKYHIASVAAGRTHSAVIDCYGHLLTFGSNTSGELGVGDCRRRKGVCLVSGPLIGQQVMKVSCGDGFTVVSTSANQIYSWGLCEDGRLGSLPAESGRGMEALNCSHPRPIFGSLHVVSDISSQRWTTILIAEKVLTQKTIRCTLRDDRSLSHEGHDREEEDRIERDASGLTTNSVIPEWLKLELEDADVTRCRQDTPQPQGDVSDSAVQVALLQTKVHDLETENTKLNQLVAQQENTIRTQRDQILLLEAKVSDVNT